MRLKQVVVLAMNMPAITYDEFFNEEHIIDNVARLLGVDPANVSRMINDKSSHNYLFVANYRLCLKSIPLRMFIYIVNKIKRTVLLALVQATFTIF